MKKCSWLCILLALCLLTGCTKPAASEPEPSYAPEPEMLDGPDSYVEPEPEPAPAPGPESEIEQVPAPTAESAPEPEPETAPEPPVEPEPEPVDILGEFSAEQRQRLNLFLSNFSEVPLGDFDRAGGSDPAQYVSFAYLHNKINSFGRDKIEVRRRGDESFYTISVADVDTCLERYLGVRLNGNLGGWDFDGERFYFIAADGEAYNNFTVARELFSDGSGTYRVTFDIYNLDILTYFKDDGVSSAFYALTAAEAAENSLLTYRGSGEATLEDYDNNGSPSYRLLTYDDPLR